MADIITVIRDPDRSLGKRFSMTPEGSVRKTSEAAVRRAIARQHQIKDVIELQSLLRAVASDPSSAITPSAFPLVNREDFAILSAQQFENLGINRRDPSIKWPVKVTIDKKEFSALGRFKEHTEPSSWLLFDRDQDDHTPESIRSMSFDDWLDALDQLIPGVKTCARLRAHSSSARVLMNGQSIGGGNGHLWLQVVNPSDIERFKGAVLSRAIELGMVWKKPRIKQETGEITGWTVATIIDLSVLTTGRLVFVGQPVVSSGLTLADQSFELIKEGGRLDTSAVRPAKPEVVKQALKDKVQIDADVKATRNGGIVIEYNDLRLDMMLETQVHGVMTVRDAINLPQNSKEKLHIRCQTPFRDSSSWAAFIGMSSAGKPFIYDSGSGMHWLCDDDWHSQLMEGFVTLDEAPKSDVRTTTADDSRASRPHVLAEFVDYDLSHLRPREFILDNIIVAGIVLIAGSTGVGKTTQLVPLLCRVAHLCHKDDTLRPLLRRKVIYVAEDVVQVEHVLASMKEAREFDGIPPAEVKDWFRLVEAKRLDASDIVKVRQTYDELSYLNVSADGVVFNAKPLVVFDTAAATISLENESDNSQVSASVAMLKQNFNGMPLIIVAHLAKALKRADVTDYSVRGANAWEGDAHQVCYLAHDDRDNERWLEIKCAKHRFATNVSGIRFSLYTSTTFGTDVLGNAIAIDLNHGVPSLVSSSERQAQKEHIAATQQMEKAEAVRSAVRAKLRSMLTTPSFAGYATKNELASGVGNRQATLITIETMILEGELIEVPLEKKIRRNNAHSVGIVFGNQPETPADEDEFF